MTNKLKRLLVYAAAGVLYYSGLLWLWMWLRKRISNSSVCIIGLHRVLSDEQQRLANSLDGVIVREETFSRFLEFLNRWFSVVSLDSFLETMGREHAASKPRCLLTFDDGWRDNFSTALPWLKRFETPAVVFAVTSFIEDRQTFWVERLRSLWQDPEKRKAIEALARLPATARSPEERWLELVEHLKHMPAQRREEVLAPLLQAARANDHNSGDEILSWPEAASLQEAGIEIESHTATHPLLVYEDDPTVKQELACSKRAIETRLKKVVRAFAYPNGNHDERIRNRVRAAGYSCAFTTSRGWFRQGDDPYTIRRIMLHEGKLVGLNNRFSPAVVALRLSGLI